MKSILIFLTSILICIFSFSQEVKKPLGLVSESGGQALGSSDERPAGGPEGFFGAKFRTKRSEIKSLILSKGGNLVDKNDEIDVYKNLFFSGYETAFISYVFKNDLMVNGMASIPCTPIKLFDTYNNVINGIKEKYGKPTQVEERFVEPYTKGDGYETTAIKTGNASFSTLWFFQYSSIMVRIENDLSIMILYSQHIMGSNKSDY